MFPRIRFRMSCQPTPCQQRPHRADESSCGFECRPCALSEIGLRVGASQHHFWIGCREARCTLTSPHQGVIPMTLRLVWRGRLRSTPASVRATTHQHTTNRLFSCVSDLFRGSVYTSCPRLHSKNILRSTMQDSGSAGSLTHSAALPPRSALPAERPRSGDARGVQPEIACSGWKVGGRRGGGRVPFGGADALHQLVLDLGTAV